MDSFIVITPKEAYDEVIKNGYSPQKVVMGMLSGKNMKMN